jgi:hypothetical protein
VNPPVRQSFVIDDLGASAPPVVGPARVYAIVVIVRLEAQARGVVHRHIVTLVFEDSQQD